MSSPTGSLTANEVAHALFVTKRTLQRRLERDGTSYREITEKLISELAARHLRDYPQRNQRPPSFSFAGKASIWAGKIP